MSKTDLNYSYTYIIIKMIEYIFIYNTKLIVYVHICSLMYEHNKI